MLKSWNVFILFCLFCISATKVQLIVSRFELGNSTSQVKNLHKNRYKLTAGMGNHVELIGIIQNILKISLTTERNVYNFISSINPAKLWNFRFIFYYLIKTFCQKWNLLLSCKIFISNLFYYTKEKQNIYRNAMWTWQFVPHHGDVERRCNLWRISADEISSRQ